MRKSESKLVCIILLVVITIFVMINVLWKKYSFNDIIEIGDNNYYIVVSTLDAETIEFRGGECKKYLDRVCAGSYFYEGKYNNMMLGTLTHIFMYSEQDDNLIAQFVISDQGYMYFDGKQYKKAKGD